MPIYEFSCEDCGTRFEKLVRNSDTVLCPQCGENHLRQELSVFATRAGANGSPQPQFGGCGAGMCRTPDVCGRN